MENDIFTELSAATTIKVINHIAKIIIIAIEANIMTLPMTTFCNFDNAVFCQMKSIPLFKYSRYFFSTSSTPACMLYR